MAFTSKRGRPKQNKLEIVKTEEKRDLGTAELQFKRLQGLTAEPIDIIHEKGIVTPEQYYAAMHFRWLYTIRFGAPGISAVDLSENRYGREIGRNDEKWQEEREREYAMAVEKLRASGCLKTVMNIVLFNHMPSFLKKSHIIANFRQVELDLDKFRSGLDILVGLWGRNNRLGAENRPV